VLHCRLVLHPNINARRGAVLDISLSLCYSYIVNFEHKKLDGIKILVPSYEQDQQQLLAVLFGGKAIRDVYTEIQLVIDEAQANGAEIIKVGESDIEGLKQQLSDPSTFAIETPKSLIEEAEHDFFENAGRNIPRPRSFPYDEYKDNPFFPAFLASNLNGGYAKYLIENEAQFQKFHSLINYFSEYKLSNMFEAREFISTPSDRYTSYRIVLSASGEPIAAGLLYSGHTKDQKKVIEVPRDRTWDQIGDNMLDGLENPISPFFLNARDTRSNINQGGGVIPLMGGRNARHITLEEEGILSEHGVDPRHIQVAHKLLEQVTIIGENIGKYYGMAVGVDFMQDVKTGKFYFLEANSGPGGRTVAECWDGGKENMSVAKEQRAVLEKSLSHLLRKK
jgi:hypothetical protein